jgi:ABC-type oligopeptide transport system ATPase subunit
MKPALLVHQLCKTYVHKPWLGKEIKKEVLRGIDLTLFSGKVLGLVGESGCGKSTLCKVVLGIEPITSGQVKINGQDISKLSVQNLQKLRQKLQVIYQDPYASLDPRFTVRQLLAEPLDIHGLYTDKFSREKYLKELLQSVQLDSVFLDRFPHEFSGGQRQRIAIARALALNPQILIADEPVSALDVSVQAQILNLLKDIQRARNLSMLFVTHDFAVARFLCDDIAVMHEGKIVEYASTETLFTSPTQAYTRKLLEAVPCIPGRTR